MVPFVQIKYTMTLKLLCMKMFTYVNIIRKQNMKVSQIIFSCFSCVESEGIFCARFVKALLRVCVYISVLCTVSVFVHFF